MKGRIKIIAINLAVIACLLVLLEIASRIALGKIYNRRFDSSILVNNKYATSSGMRPYAATTLWGKTLTTDADGWRNVKKREPRKNKWLFIGDSVTEGVGVDDSSTFASLCSEQLIDFNICNCSLIGYSTNDYVNVLNSFLQQDSAAVELVTVFYCLNDVYGPAKSNNLPTMAKRSWAGKLNTLLQDRYATYKLIKLWFYKNSDHYFNYDLQFYKPSDSHFTAAMQHLKTCDTLCKARNIYFNVVVLPYQSQLGSHNYIPQLMVKQYCKANGIEFSDAAELLAKQPDYPSLYLFADEIHLSAKGHKIVADFLSE